jgi:hypothetical protein
MPAYFCAQFTSGAFSRNNVYRLAGLSHLLPFLLPFLPKTNLFSPHDNTFLYFLIMQTNENEKYFINQSKRQSVQITFGLLDNKIQLPLRENILWLK